MRSWLRGLYTRTTSFDMLRSIWYANLDVMVDNIRYLQDDCGQYQQHCESCKSNQPIEPKQCDQSSHHCANHSAGICGCTRYDNSHNNCGNTRNNNIYNELINSIDANWTIHDNNPKSSSYKSRSTQRERLSTRLWDCIVNAISKCRLQYAARTTKRVHSI